VGGSRHGVGGNSTECRTREERGRKGEDSGGKNEQNTRGEIRNFTRKRRKQRGKHNEALGIFPVDWNVVGAQEETGGGGDR